MSRLTRIPAHLKDLGGGFVVRRLLPAVARQSVGPFLFFDHFGPVLETPGRQHDVRPHPHIGLATVTYLFEGAMQHRDSLGSDQRIEPGAINLMTAGRGIVHSERKPADLLEREYLVHGLQLWAALPLAQEQCEPCFEHTPASALPRLEEPGLALRVLMGEAYGLRSPVQALGGALYLDIRLDQGGTLTLPDQPEQLALYTAQGQLEAEGETLDAQTLYAWDRGPGLQVQAREDSRFVLIGGDPLDGGRRQMWWNFVASRPELIEQAKREWAGQAMGQVPGEQEWIPLPAR